MTDEKIFEMFQKLADSLRETIDTLKQMLSNHETRITVLETKKDSSWQNQLLMLLAKAILIGGVAIASLAGAGGILTKIIGV